MSYFTLEESAERYDAYRPKVHDIVDTWLSDAGINIVFNNSLDVACGTGDSTLPLLKISRNVLGIDLSESMLKKAEEKGLSVKRLGYERAHELGSFDLITTCMAFHWFNFEDALAAYKKASSKNSVWLIYNFTFGGSENSEEFNDWFVSRYLKEFPSPKRNKEVADFENADGVRHLASGKGTLPIKLANKVEVTKYLTTQSNIEDAVKSGMSYEDVEKKINSMLEGFDLGTNFLYNYSYDLYQFDGN
jgi:ubiquinone/menaquinone biosynthesis C-methylase UbiE